MTTPKPNPSDPSKARPSQISANRRGFFRQMLILGLEGVEHMGRQVGQRLGDIAQDADNTPTATPPPPKPDRDQNAQSRSSGKP